MSATDEPQPGELVRYWPPGAEDYKLLRFVRFENESTAKVWWGNSLIQLPRQYITRQPDIEKEAIAADPANELEETKSKLAAALEALHRDADEIEKGEQ